MPPAGKLPDETIADFATMDQDGCSRPARRLGQERGGGRGDRLRGRAQGVGVHRAEGRHHPPEVREAGWPPGAIDRFVLARQEAAGVRPGPDAPPGVWLRRVAFDLVGLPPTPEQVEAILTRRLARGTRRRCRSLARLPRLRRALGQTLDGCRPLR